MYRGPTSYFMLDYRRVIEQFIKSLNWHQESIFTQAAENEWPKKNLLIEIKPEAGLRLGCQTHLSEALTFFMGKQYWKPCHPSSAPRIQEKASIKKGELDCGSAIISRLFWMEPLFTSVFTVRFFIIDIYIYILIHIHFHCALPSDIYIFFSGAHIHNI